MDQAQPSEVDYALNSLAEDLKQAQMQKAIFQGKYLAGQRELAAVKQELTELKQKGSPEPEVVKDPENQPAKKR